MAEEKEIKIQLFENKDSKEIHAKLSKHLKLSKTVVQTDYYYDNVDFLFTKRDRGLRIRFVGGSPVDFTCKALFYIPKKKPSPWHVEEHVFKLPTKEINTIREIFERFDLQFDQDNNLLTYADLDICFRKNKLSPKLVIEKKREIFIYDDAEVILDEVKDLGVFIEIETKISSPMDIAKKLDLLKYGTRTIEGYTTLLSRKLGLAEMKQREPLYIENPTWNVFPKEKETLLLKDFHAMNLLSTITIKPILPKEFPQADAFMEKHLYKGKRPRTYEFLLEKCKENPTFFLALYLDTEMAGVVQGFPRDDYLLMSELAVDIRFQKRSFGAKLVKAFEENAKKLNYTRIKLGADDKAVQFYASLGYKPSLFIQVPEEKKDATVSALKKDKQEIVSVSIVNHLAGIEVAVDSIDQKKLASMKKQFNPISAQFLFSKDL